MNKVVIDVEGKFTDGISGPAGTAIHALERFTRTKVFVKFDANASPFLKVLNKAESQAKKFGNTKLAAKLEAIDQATRVIGNVWNLGIKFGSAVWRATISVLDKATAPIRGVFNLLKNPVMQAGAALGLSFGTANMLNTYSNFETAMSNVGAVSGATGLEMEALTAKAKEMGAATKFTAAEAGEAMGYMAMAGWKASDMLNGIEGIMNLAAAGGENLAKTSDIVTDALTAFKMTAADSGHFADVLAAASSNANTNVSMMGETFKYVGTQAGALGYSIEDVALATGLMANSGVKASMAGTSFSSVLTRLSTNTNGAQDAIKALGVEFFDSSGKARKWRDVMEGLRTATADMTTEQKAAFAKTVAGQEAQKGFLAILEASTTDYNKLASAIDNANGSAARMSKTMQDNLAGSMTLLKSAADGAIISIMDRAAPHLRKGIDWLTSKMPVAGNTVGKAMDFVGGKIEWVANQIRKVTSSPDFKFGNTGEKIKLLWNGVITDPISEWWDGGGREKTRMASNTVGREIGELFKTGLLGVFGVTDLLQDDGSITNAGSSIARSFAEGFAEGFDASLVSDKLRDALSNVGDKIGDIWDIMPGWGKALTGGIIGSKIISGVSSGLLGAISVYNGLKALVGTSKATPESIYGSGLLGLGKLTAVGIGGQTAGSTLTAGQMSALGLGEVAGILTTGAGIIHTATSAFRAYQGFKEGDKTKGWSNTAKAGVTALGIGGGALAGAKLGATFGTAVGGPAGAIIGAGIGTAIGWFAGDKIARHIEAARYESEEMRDAIKDTNMSAEDLARTFDKAVYSNMKDHFGDMALSLGEIQRLSQQVAFGSDLPAYNKFTSSTQAAESSLKSLQSAAEQTNHWMWKASLGVKFNESEIGAIQTSFDDYINSAKAYVENKHYAFTAAVELLMDPSSEGAKNIINSGNTLFSGLQEQLNSLGSELSNTVKISLGDGFIDIDEQAAISDLQGKIASILDQVANAKQSAQLDLIELKFGAGKLSIDSFDSFMSQMQSSINERMTASEEAYVEASAGIKLQLENGIINQDECNRQLSELNSQYTAKIDSLKADVMGFELNIIGDAYKDVLGPDAADKLSKALSDSMKAGIDPIEWSTADAEKFLNTPNLSEETAGAIGKMLSGVSSQLKQLDISGTVNADFDVKPDTGLAEKVKIAIDAQTVETNANFKVNADWEVSSVGDPGNEILALVSPDGQYAVPFNVLAEVGWTIGGDPFNPEIISPDGQYSFPIAATAEAQWNTTGKFDSKMLDPGGPFSFSPGVSISPKASYKKLNPKQTDFGVPSSMNSNTSINAMAQAFTQKLSFTQEDFGVPSSMNSHTSINAAAQAITQKVSLTQESFGIPRSLSAHTTIYVTQNTRISKSSANGYVSTNALRSARGGIIGPNGPMGFAEGGMVRGGPQLVTVAEEGTPEMIIPLGSQRRERGLQLWRKAGQMLGAEGFANGGIAGRYGRMAETPDFRTHEVRSIRQELDPLPRRESHGGSGGAATVSVNLGDVNVTLQVDVDGSNGDDVLTCIKQNTAEIADMVAGEMRRAMQDMFVNTPLLGGETA